VPLIVGMGKAAELGRKYLRGYEKKARPPWLMLLFARLRRRFRLLARSRPIHQLSKENVTRRLTNQAVVLQMVRKRVRADFKMSCQRQQALKIKILVASHTFLK
jgi:hypothetical protein